MTTRRFSPDVRRRTVLAAGAAAVTFGLAACGGGGGGGAGSGGGTYRVGVLLGLTGSYAALGVPEQQAIELYFEQVNADGGINGREVELVVLDSASDEGTAVNQFRKLAVEEQVHAVLGPSSSGESSALRTFSKDMSLPTIGLASSSSIVEPPEEATHMFKQYTGTNESMLAQLQYSQEQGWNRVALLHTNDGYGQDAEGRIQAVADEVGVEVTGVESFDAAATDVTAQLGSLSEGEPDAVLVWAVNPANAIVAQSASSIGFEPALFNSPGAGSAAYIETGGDAVEGTYLQGSVVLAAASLTEEDSQYEVTNTLVDSFEEKYGEMPGQYAANGWDGGILLKNALEQAAEHDPGDVQGTRDAIRDSLENNTQEVVGVNAIYTFTPEFHGSVELNGLAVLQVVDGEFAVEQTY